METESKTAQFIDVINREAQAQYEKIKKETDDYVASELEKAREAAKLNAKAAAKTQVGRLSEQSNTDTYKTRIQLIRQIVAKRKEITDSVFEKALKEIRAFTEKPEYADFLIKSAYALKAATGDDTVIFIRPEDEKYKDMLSGIASVELDKSIHLGGCRGESKANSMRADDTLDSRFEQQKQEFYSWSGLSVI